MKDINLSDPKVLDAFNQLAKRRWGLLLALLGIGSFSSIIITGVQAVGWMIALWLGVNFVLPPLANLLALMKVKSMRLMAEELSIEEILKHEAQEGEAMKLREDAYKERSASSGASVDSLKEVAQTANNPQQKQDAEDAIKRIEASMGDQLEDLKFHRANYQDLVNGNKMLIAVEKDAQAQLKAQGAVSNPEQLQQLRLARQAILDRSRRAAAGQQIAQMQQSINGGSHVSKTADALTHYQPQILEQEVHDGQKVVR